MSPATLVLAACAITGTVLAGTARAAPTPEQHLRLTTAHGAIHVWMPAGYDPASAAIVVYVHGFYTTVDDAWFDYHLATQFRTSRLDALFIACEAPDSLDAPVQWGELGDLLAIVGRAVPLPHGRVVAIGHSGAYRTLDEWLDEPRLDTIALVDAAYGPLAPYRAWLEARPARRLIDVGDQVRELTDAFHAHVPETVVIDRFPPPERGALPPAAEDARVVYVRSYMGHMNLVTGGIALPMILRALTVSLVGDADRTTPLMTAPSL